MKLIVGLGNPGEKYEKTRHTIGFMVANKLAKKLGYGFNYEQKFEADLTDIDGVKIVKPQTYMNESGQSVRKVKAYYKAINKNIFVCHDDVDLEVGKVRVQFGGSSAGHRGVQSVIDNIGPDFWRIRIGVGRDEKISTDVWVLKKITTEEMKKFEIIIDKVVDFMIDSLGQEVVEHTIKIN